MSVLKEEVDIIQIIPVNTEEQLVKFVQLPEKIYRDNHNWPGHNFEEELKFHQLEYNFPLKYLKTRLFLAVRDDEIIGRISAIVNERHNDRWNDNIGFFGHFECIDDQEVANKLLYTAQKWVQKHGRDEIIGPFSYTYYDIIGVLIDKFDERPTIGLAFNPPYYPLLLENAGYVKKRDVVEILADVDDHYEILIKKEQEIEHLIKDHRYTIRTIDESCLREEFLTILDLYNDSFSKHWMARPLDSDEWIAMMESIYEFLPNNLFLIAEDQGKPVAFLFHVHDEFQNMFYQRNKISKSVDRIKAYVIGIRYEYHKLGIAKWLSIEAVKRMKQMGYKEISFSWIDAKNKKSISLTTSMGGHVDKNYRIYTKQL